MKVKIVFSACHFADVPTLLGNRGYIIEPSQLVLDIDEPIHADTAREMIDAAVSFLGRNIRHRLCSHFGITPIPSHGEIMGKVEPAPDGLADLTSPAPEEKRRRA